MSDVSHGTGFKPLHREPQDSFDDDSFANDGRILPKSLQQFLFNRFLEILGLFIMALVAFAAISIASWSASDPSLNHATSEVAQNSLGIAGAYVSDFLIQTFGLAILFLFVPILLVGINLIRHKSVQRPILRSIAWLFAGLFIAGSLSAIPVFNGWPLKMGLGGVAGDVSINIAADLLGSSVHPVATVIAAILLAVLGLILGLYACGLRFKEIFAALTFMNEASFDSGAQLVQNAKNTSSLLGRKSLSLANHIASLKGRRSEPFTTDKKPWKVRDDNAPLEYQNLTDRNQNLAAMNETDMKNAPEFLSRMKAEEAARLGGNRNKVYSPLKARTNQLFSKIKSGLSQRKGERQAEYENRGYQQHIDPSFNPHAFEPIGRNAPHVAPVAAPATAPHIPALHQEVRQHVKHEQQYVAQDPYQINNQPAFNRPAPQAMVHKEVVGSADMGDFYDGPNSYEDYWVESEHAAQPHPHPVQNVAPQYIEPQYSEPQYVEPQNVAPQYAEPQYVEPQYVAPQFVEPQYVEPQMQPAQAFAPVAYQEAPYQDAHAFEAAPVAPQFAEPQTYAAPQPVAAPAPIAQPFVATPPVAAPIAAAPVAARPIAAAPVAPAPMIEPAEPATAISPQPFDLSAPQVNVRKGRVVSDAATGFNHGPGANHHYELPSIDLLSMPEANAADQKVSEKILAANARILENVLAEFRISGEIMNVRPGPVVTLYELEPAPGVKSARVISLADDIARSMSAISARIAVIPGRNIIGIELPNEHRDTVYLNEIISSDEFNGNKFKLPMALGKSIDGTPIVADLARMPHLLIAGTTGSGKSVGINSMILSILYKMPPEKCKLIMVDPKMLELSVYDGIPHLLTPVVTDPKKAVVALKWSVREMENRYKKMSKMGVRNIEGYNQRIRAAEAKGEPLVRTVQTGFDHNTGKPVYEHEALQYEEMPFIVIVIDEMADLMMVAGKEIEGVIQRLAQMARAAGIHMITATQRPSVDVITGSIKANFPTRISFQVTSKIDSRTILNEMGAEQLLGQGDMLHMAGGGRINRVHGAYVADEEVESVVNHLKRQGVPEYIEDITVDVEGETETAAPDGGPAPIADENGEALDLYDQAVAIVARDKKASTSYIQRKLSIGYNRAATIIERMEEEGVIGAANHAGKREILVGDHS